MKVVIAIDSFKGSLTSLEAGKAIEQGIKRVYLQSEVLVKPLADGGEGTVETLVEGMNGRIRRLNAMGPLGNMIECSYGIIDAKNTAVIEIAKIVGLTLITKEQRNPLNTTTYGIGQIIIDAIKQGCRHFIIGIGGSATNDGGIGMLQALGFGMLDKRGNQVEFGAKGLKQLEKIDDSGVLPVIKECKFMIACDVTNPVCGPFGASAVYGLQKGADQEMIKEMDIWLNNYAVLSKQKFIQSDACYPGSGAAGGLGFAFLTYLNAKLESGIDLILREIKLEEEIKDADLVITGEGRLDYQTAMGKAPAGVAKLAKKYQLPVIAFSGAVAKGAEKCNDLGIDAYFPILRDVTTLSEAMDQQTASENMINAVEQVFRLWQICKKAGDIEY